jgi:predicted ATP-grasp superfamily ATP-dependent carboligase
MSHPSIIFNCNYNGLSIIQELGQHNVKCIAMDHYRSIGTFSKYAKYVHCSNAATEEKKFIEELYQLCSRQAAKPVLFPTNDLWAQAISKYKSRLEEVAIPCVAPATVVELTLNKFAFYKLGRERNYMTPETYASDEILNISERIKYPIIAKPNARRSSSNEGEKMRILEAQLDRLRLTVINNAGELKSFLNKEGKYVEHMVFQQFIPGNSDYMYTVGIYADRESNIKAVFTGRKVRGYPAEFGDCILGEVYNLPQNLIDNTRRITKEIGFQGIAEFEYKLHSQTGEYYLIEINPRSWSWVGITPYCGVSLPWIAYTDLTGGSYNGKINSFHLNNGEVKYMKYLEDRNNCLFRYKKTFPEWHMSKQEWKKSLSAKILIKAEFNNDFWVAAMSLYFFWRNKIVMYIKRVLKA